VILDNLSRALKTQNWLAAAIEFVIVIAGVVIGFQINAWNEARQDRALEGEYLERLYADMSGAIMRRCNLDGVDFRSAQFGDAELPGSTDKQPALMERSQMREPVLTGRPAAPFPAPRPASPPPWTMQF